MKKTALALVMLVITSLSAQPLLAQSPAIRWLTQKGCEITIWAQETDYLCQIIDTNRYKSYRLFMTGETHGVRNTEKVMLHLLKFYHQYYKVRYFLVEAGVSTGYLLNTFLTEGDTSSLKKALLARGFHLGTQEYYQFFRELRSFNLSLPVKERITVWGLDVEWQYQLPFEILIQLLTVDTVPAEIKPIIAHMQRINRSSSEELLTVERVTESCLQHLQKHDTMYRRHLDTNFLVYKTLLENIQNTYNSSINRLSRRLKGKSRDQIAFENLVKLQPFLKSGNFNAHWGRIHAYKRKNKFFAYLLNEHTESPFKNGVLSLGLFYNNCSSLLSSVNPFKDQIDYGKYDYFNQAVRHDFVLYPLNNPTPPFTKLNREFDFLMYISNQAAATKLLP